MKGVDDPADRGDIEGMATYATGITLIQYRFMGAELTDRVLLLRSDGKHIAHALGINLLGSGTSDADAINALSETIDFFVQAVSADPGRYTHGQAPAVLQKIWDDIFSVTSFTGALEPQKLKNHPHEVHIPIAV